MPLEKIDIAFLSWDQARNEAYRIRELVFIKEQGVPKELEIDEHDPSAIHVLAQYDGQCIGTARLVSLGNNKAQIGRMAVLADYRGRSVGKTIMDQLLLMAKSKGIDAFILHAQLSAIPFYEKLGFIAQGPIYDEAGIPHRNMMLNVPNSF